MVRKGMFYLNDIVVGNTNVIYELAALQKFTFTSFFEFISDNCEISLEKISIVKKALKNISEHGLWKYNESTDADCFYYDGEYIYTNGLVIKEKISFFDFDRKYPQSQKIVKSFIGF